MFNFIPLELNGVEQELINQLLHLAKKKGFKFDKKEESELRKKISENYEDKTDILYAASQLWVDAVIDPSETRSWISMGIDMANQSPTKEKFNMGVLQV